MEKGERQNVRILVSGSDKVDYELPPEHGLEGVIQTATCVVSSIGEITPFDFYNGYIHQRDSNDSGSRYSGYVNELADRYIDRTLRYGQTYIDCRALGGSSIDNGYLTAAMIDFDIAPKETRRLEVISALNGGWFLPDDRKTAESYCPVFTEPLNSFASAGKIEVIVRPPAGAYGVRLMPKSEKAKNTPVTYELNGKLNQNIIVIYNEKNNNQGNSLLWAIVRLIAIKLWPMTLLILGLLVYLLYRFFKARRSKKIMVSTPVSRIATRSCLASHPADADGGLTHTAPWLKSKENREKGLDKALGQML